MRNDPWKFESTWRSESWIEQTTQEEFLASTGYLYISDKVIGGTGSYLMLTGDKIQYWVDGGLVAEWDSIVVTAPPPIGNGQLMGLLCLTYTS